MTLRLIENKMTRCSRSCLQIDQKKNGIFLMSIQNPHLGKKKRMKVVWHQACQILSAINFTQKLETKSSNSGHLHHVSPLASSKVKTCQAKIARKSQVILLKRNKMKARFLEPLKLKVSPLNTIFMKLLTHCNN